MMTTEQSQKFMEEYISEFSRNPSEETIDKYIADEHLKSHIILFQSGLPGYKLIKKDMIAEGNKVTLRGVVEGEHKGDLFGVPATGRKVSFDIIVIYELDNNKVVNHWMQADSVALMQQIGASPVPAGN